MKIASIRSLAPACALAALLFATDADALTYVPVSDGLLADRADTVVRGKVVSRRVSDETGRVMTTYEVDVLGQLKGAHPGSRLLVRVPGGIDLEAGFAVKIFGTPEFAPGDSMLFFLSTSSDAYRVLHVFQGAFFERSSADGRFYERPGKDAYEVARSRSALGRAGSAKLEIRSSPPAPRDAALFESWIEDRLAGLDRPADYFLREAPARSAAAVAPFTYLAGDDIVLRWFEVDDGKKIRWHRHRDGQDGFSDGGSKAFKKARKAWKKKFSGVPIRLTNSGRTSSSTGFVLSDDRNTIIFSDLNDTIDDDFECPGGGVLAIGGVSSADFFITPWKDLAAVVSHEGEIVMNDGIDCFVDGDADIIGQIYAHELGHTLGLGHSCGDSSSPKCRKSEMLANALMAASLDRVFGPEIHDDDVLAARQIYDEDFWAAACENKVPGSASFCRKCGPCGLGQGNCKNDSDCFGDLECVKDIGAAFGFDPDTNVCTEP